MVRRDARESGQHRATNATATINDAQRRTAAKHDRDVSSRAAKVDSQGVYEGERAVGSEKRKSQRSAPPLDERDTRFKLFAVASMEPGCEQHVPSSSLTLTGGKEMQG